MSSRLHDQRKVCSLIHSLREAVQIHLGALAVITGNGASKDRVVKCVCTRKNLQGEQEWEILAQVIVDLNE